MGALPPTPPFKGVLVLPGKQPPTLPPAAGSPPPSPFCWGKDQPSLPWGGLSLPQGWAAGRLQVWEEGSEVRGAWKWGDCHQENLFYFQGDSFGRWGEGFVKEDPVDRGGQRATRKVGKAPQEARSSFYVPAVSPILASRTVSLCHSLRQGCAAVQNPCYLYRSFTPKKPSPFCWYKKAEVDGGCPPLCIACTAPSRPVWTLQASHVCCLWVP